MMVEHPVVLGRIVRFVFDAATVTSANRNPMNNPYAVGQEAPGVIVRIWSPTMVNLKVLLDGPEDIWVTSVPFDATGLRPFSWRFVPILERDSHQPDGLFP